MKKMGLLLLTFAFIVLAFSVFAFAESGRGNGNVNSQDDNESNVNETLQSGNNSTNSTELDDVNETDDDDENESELDDVNETDDDDEGNRTRNRTRIEGLSDEKKEIIAGKINAKTGLNLSVEDIGNGTVGSILRAYLSNGRYALVKVMPDTAAENALIKLRAKCQDRNCTVELKEVGEGNETKAVWRVKTQKESRILFLFKKNMTVEADVDSDTGDVVSSNKPWWAFLAKEKNYNADEVEQEFTNSTD